MGQVTWNDKVSQKRGAEWRAKLVHGRLDAAMNPTKLKLKRVAKNLSQEEVAEKLGLSLTTYGAIERGRRPVKFDLANELAKVLKSKKADILTKTPKGKFLAKK